MILRIEAQLPTLELVLQAKQETLARAGHRIQTIGMGESDPRASNDTAQGRAMNRRVSITIVPQQGAQ